MEVSVRLFTTLREIIGSWQIKIRLRDDASLKELIETLAETYGSRVRDYLCREDGIVRENINFFINGVKIDKSHIESVKLKKGDTVAIIPPISGGV